MSTIERFLAAFIGTVLLAAVIIILSTILGWAEEQPRDLLGVGNTTCAELASKYKKYPDIVDTVYFEWYAGFVSGANASWVSTTGHTKNISGFRVKDKMNTLRRFCDEHPMLRFSDAALEDYVSLPNNRVQ